MRIVGRPRHISSGSDGSRAPRSVTERAGCDACRDNLSTRHEQIRHAALLLEYDRLVRNGGAPQKRRRSTRLNQAISELRDRLGHFMPRGRRLVQTRRTVGFRIALRKADAR